MGAKDGTPLTKIDTGFGRTADVIDGPLRGSGSTDVLIDDYLVEDNAMIIDVL